jgi:Domain of Unknown Function (DUF928)
MKFHSVLLIALVLFFDISLYSAPVRAEDRDEDSSNPPLKSELPEPSDRGTPTDSGNPLGTRGNCPETDFPFRPLLPRTNAKFSGFTLSESPTFWFYIPYQTNSITRGEFRLEDRERNLHAKIFLVLPQTPGFVSIPLQLIEKPLEKNKQYYWIFVLDCVARESSEPDRVWQDGWIERIDRPELEAQLQTATLEQRLNLYLDNQIWYDASKDLVEIRNFPPAWRKLLDDFDLEYLDRETISGPVELNLE